jgi:MFS family permease
LADSTKGGADGGMGEPRLWRNADFLRLWVGQVVSTAGSGISRLALPLLVLALTDSPAQAGLIGAAQNAPFLVLGLPAGALLDRWNRKTVMVTCEVARFVAYGSIPLAWWLGTLTMAHLYAVAIVHGTTLAFFSIAQLAALPRVVPPRQLSEAHALNTATEGIASLASPGLGGLLIGLAPTVAAGAAVAYLADSISYAVSAVSLATIRTAFQTPRAAAPLRQLHRQIVEGMRFLWERMDLRWLIVVNTLHRTCFAPVQLAVVVLATRALGADAQAVGLLFSAAGAGGLAASFFTPWVRRRVSVGHSMVGLLLAHAAGLALVAGAPALAIAALGLAIAGAMENMTGIIQVSYRLGVIPDALQGRVNSSYRMVSFMGITLGTAVGGLLIEALDARLVMALLALSIGAIGFLAAVTPTRRI